MLRTFLIVRAAFNLLFGAALLYWLAHDSLSGLLRGGWYAVVDGVLTLAIAAALLGTRGRWLALLAAADGVLRLAAGTFILVNPGLEQMPVTASLFLVLMTIAFITLGTAGLVYGLVGARRQASATGETPLTWPAAAISLCTLLLGVGFALTFFDQQLRVLLAYYAIALAVILGAAATRVGRSAADAGRPAGVVG